MVSKYKLFSLTCLSLFIIMVGMFMNYNVMIMNGGKMPIQTDSRESILFREEQSIPFINNHEVKLPYFSDIIKIKLGDNYNALISIGDVLLFCGIIMFMFVFIKYIILSKEENYK